MRLTNSDSYLHKGHKTPSDLSKFYTAEDSKYIKYVNLRVKLPDFTYFRECAYMYNLETKLNKD